MIWSGDTFSVFINNLENWIIQEMLLIGKEMEISGLLVRWRGGGGLWRVYENNGQRQVEGGGRG